MSKKEYKRKIKELEKREKKGYELSWEENEMLRDYYWNQSETLSKWSIGFIYVALACSIVRIILFFIDAFC